jgi:hypothetical protein
MNRWRRAVRLKVKPINVSSVPVPQQQANLAEFAAIVKEHFHVKSFHPKPRQVVAPLLLTTRYDVEFGQFARGSKTSRNATRTLH